DLRKAHGILLRRDDGVGLAFLAPVDDIQHLLLSEPVVVGKTLRVNELAADLREAQFEAFRLCNPTERGDLPALDQIEAMSFAREYVFEVKRVMHTLDDPGGAVVLRNALTERGRVAIALGDEDDIGARQVR